MTEKALSLLSDKCKEHLETLSILIKRCELLRLIEVGASKDKGDLCLI